MQVGLAFLPSNIDHGGVLARPLGADRHALRPPPAARRRPAAAPPPGLALFARAPVDGSFVVDVLPGMLLLGLGAGIAFNPLLLAAMSDVDESESGLASGIVNTSFMMGGALGLAVLASLAAAHTGVGRRARRGAARRSTPAIASLSAPARCSRSSPPALGALLLPVRARGTEGDAAGPHRRADPRHSRTGVARRHSGRRDTQPAASCSVRDSPSIGLAAQSGTPVRERADLPSIAVELGEAQARAACRPRGNLAPSRFHPFVARAACAIAADGAGLLRCLRRRRRRHPAPAAPAVQTVSVTIYPATARSERHRPPRRRTC